MTIYLKYFLLLLCIFCASCSNRPVDDIDRWNEIKLYRQAKSALTRGEFERAIEHLQTLEARYPFGEYAQQGQLDLAYGYYRAGRIEEAITTTQRFIRTHPTHSHLDYVYYLQGVADFDRHQSLLDAWFARDPSQYDPSVLKDAYRSLSTLVSRFPESRYAADAEQRLIYLRNEMAEHCLNIANWYVRRTAYVAAANQAQECIQQFNGAPGIEAGLDIMAQSYRQLNIDDLAVAIEKVKAQISPH